MISKSINLNWLCLSYTPIAPLYVLIVPDTESFSAKFLTISAVIVSLGDTYSETYRECSLIQAIVIVLSTILNSNSVFKISKLLKYSLGRLIDTW